MCKKFPYLDLCYGPAYEIVLLMAYVILHFLNLCIVGNFSCFLSADFFFKLTFSKNSFRNTIRVSNGFDTDQDRHSVGPDLGPNCLERLSADDKNCPSKEIVKCPCCCIREG